MWKRQESDVTVKVVITGRMVESVTAKDGTTGMFPFWSIRCATSNVNGFGLTAEADMIEFVRQPGVRREQ